MGFWRTRNLRVHGILANKGFWRTRDLREHGILVDKGFKGTRDLQPPATYRFPRGSLAQ